MGYMSIDATRSVQVVSVDPVETVEAAELRVLAGVIDRLESRMTGIRFAMELHLGTCNDSDQYSAASAASAKDLAQAEEQWRIAHEKRTLLQLIK
jgi:hypothetical protein